MKHVEIDGHVEETIVNQSFSATTPNATIMLDRWQAEMLIAHIADEFDIDLSDVEQ